MLSAEGAKQASILAAEGERQSRILRAQGERAARYLQAQGQAKAIEKVFAAVKAGKPTPELLAYQYLQTLPQMAQGDANKVWMIPATSRKSLEGFARMLGTKGDDGVFRYEPRRRTGPGVEAGRDGRRREGLVRRDFVRTRSPRPSGRRSRRRPSRSTTRTRCWHWAGRPSARHRCRFRHRFRRRCRRPPRCPRPRRPRVSPQVDTSDRRHHPGDLPAIRRRVPTAIRSSPDSHRARAGRHRTASHRPPSPDGHRRAGDRSHSLRVRFVA